MTRNRTPARGRRSEPDGAGAEAVGTGAEAVGAGAEPVGAGAEADGAGAEPVREDVAGEPPAAGTLAPVAAFLRREAARVLDVDPARLRDGSSLIAQGLDSLGAADLAAAIEAGLGMPVSFASLLEGASLAELGELIAERLAGEAAAAAGGREAATPVEDADVAARRPLSHGQRALWLLDRMVAGGNPACVLAGAARVRGELDAARLRRALQALVARHPALRTTFET
ncbi:MAG TPA: phosphopantetheine-binding protein, partial [Thermoanaerobaculia bacterium]|nr:phosphopantetheine-binding protein [Thermoanaerobaculia bacterium]